MAEALASNDLTGRRLREASRYVSRAWIPPSTAVHKRVSEKIKKNLSRNEVLGELRSDFGLLSHCLRKLESVSAETNHTTNPADILVTMGDDDFKNILPTGTSEVSMHDLVGAKDVQLLWIKHSVISCSAVELIAERVSGDGNKAYLSALIRQLGSMLVAWNYPGSCVRAASNREASGLSFEAELAKLLGFPPEQLGIYLVTQWCKDENFLYSLGVDLPATINGGASEESKIIRDICGIGEMLAKINDPANFPSARGEWKEREKDIVRYLGPNGIKLIKDRIDERFAHYVSLQPNLYGDDLSPERALKEIDHIHSQKLFQANVYIRRCDEQVRPVFEKVYNHLYRGEMSSEALSLLVHEAIPACGFKGGCLYLLDPNRMVLVPKLRIGDSRTREFKAISCSCGGQRSHPVSEAFHTTIPLQGESVIVNNDVISHVTGKFGKGDKEGVLFLEYQNAIPNFELSNGRLMYFKAIRQSLADCLAF